MVESDCGRDTLSFQSRDQILVVLDGNKYDELIVGQEYKQVIPGIPKIKI